MYVGRYVCRYVHSKISMYPYVTSLSQKKSSGKFHLVQSGFLGRRVTSSGRSGTVNNRFIIPIGSPSYDIRNRCTIWWERGITISIKPCEAEISYNRYCCSIVLHCSITCFRSTESKPCEAEINYTRYCCSTVLHCSITSFRSTKSIHCP